MGLPVRMLCSMRITLNLHDDLLAEAKQVAARTGRTLTAVVEDALRESLHRRHHTSHPAVELPTAIESGGEWITTDRDFSRFPGLRWRHPLG
jgi:hypothetical protein